MTDIQRPIVGLEKENQTILHPAIQSVIDGTKKGIHAVASELVQITGDTMQFTGEATAYMGGKAVDTVVRSAKQAYNGVMGKKFRDQDHKQAA